MASRSFAGHAQERERFVVYIGDGVASMGHRSLSSLSKGVASLRKEYQTNFTTVGIGADSDTRTLSTVARSGGGYFIGRKSGQRPEHVAQSILESTMGVALRDAELVLPPSMSDVSPVKLSTLRAGDEVLVSARYASEIDDKITLRGTVGGKAYENSFPLHLAMTTNAGNAFVPKIWATKTIQRLETEGKAGHNDTIVAMSKSFGVMSKKTSLLVLESEAMFKAFGVDRAKPMAQWTGEEGEAEVSESMGAVGYGGMAGESLGGIIGGDMDDESAGMGSGRSASGGGKRAKRKSASVSARSPKKAPRDSKDSAPRQDKSRDFNNEMEELTNTKRPNNTATRRPPPPPASRPAPRGRGGQWMKKVWSRVASVRRYQGVANNIHKAVDKAEERLAANPDSRDRHRDLVQALSYADELARAEEIAIRWLERDRLDPEALSYLADIAARRGRRDQSIRLLSGVVDLRPQDRSLHLRLAKAYDRAGDRSRSCAHRVMLAELKPDSAKIVGDAIRCERANGRSSQAESILEVTPVASRGRAEVEAGKPARSERIHGDLRVDASWSGGSDLDIALITPAGRRISWQGGHHRVAAAQVREVGAESLGLPRLRKGRYLIEISRTHPEARGPVQGRVKINVMGQRQNIPFELLADSKVVGAIRVRMISGMVPL
jgi:tetratricopeptide (TPR) repeat protein